MANVTQLKHLEHLEDEMLNYGVDGCIASVNFLKELRKMLGCDNSTGFMQTKWDGAPSVICGTDPLNGMFFVGTKSVFAKTPKICYSDVDVDLYYEGDLAEKLKYSLKYFSTLGIKGIVQGDLLFTTDVKRETVNEEKLFTFTPNTITYAIPVDHPIGVATGKAKIGVVFHTHYRGTDFQTMQAIAGAKVKGSIEVLSIDNDTPMDRVGLNHAEEMLFDKYVSNIEKMCAASGDFLDELTTLSGTAGDAKWHVSSYLKQFFNDQIKKSLTITNPTKSLEDLTNFYHSKVKPLADKIKTPKTQVAKKKLIYDSENYLMNNADKFKSMLNLYKEIQEIKQFVIDKLDNLETFKTFVQTDMGYKVTGPEGYVLHKDGDMIKFVNRLEFSYNNFTLAKKWR
jgi:hypothetical protein|tara:strand:- start:587 stop:1777 length:1191 start_codon:yes stop_codon:yes gene_type:complete